MTASAAGTSVAPPRPRLPWVLLSITAAAFVPIMVVAVPFYCDSLLVQAAVAR